MRCLYRWTDASYGVSFVLAIVGIILINAEVTYPAQIGVFMMANVMLFITSATLVKKALLRALVKDFSFWLTTGYVLVKFLIEVTVPENDSNFASGFIDVCFYINYCLVDCAEDVSRFIRGSFSFIYGVGLLTYAYDVYFVWPQRALVFIGDKALQRNSLMLSCLSVICTMLLSGAIAELRNPNRMRMIRGEQPRRQDIIAQALKSDIATSQANAGSGSNVQENTNTNDDNVDTSIRQESKTVHTEASLEADLEKK